jgi:RNase P subunit RPR2
MPASRWTDAPSTPAYSIPSIQEPSAAELIAPTHLRAMDLSTVAGLLASMPLNIGEVDPIRGAMWSEMVRLKTKDLELQIAEARAKEREAELELERLRAGAGAMGSSAGGRAVPMTLPNRIGEPSDLNDSSDILGPTKEDSIEGFDPYSGMGTGIGCPAPLTFDTFPYTDQSLPSAAQSLIAPDTLDQTAPIPMTPYDLEVMMQEDNLDNLFSWLPDYAAASSTMNPAYMNTTSPPLTSFPDDLTQAQLSARKRRSPSPSSDISDQPAAKRGKRIPEKKIVIDHLPLCMTCSKPLGKIMIRALRSSIPEPTSVSIQCISCRPVEVVPVPKGSTSSSTTMVIGTVDSRKRLRAGMEIDDDETGLGEQRKRVFCDVCQRVVGSGGVWGGNKEKGEREGLMGMVEVVCASCDAKYQR